MVQIDWTLGPQRGLLKIKILHKRSGRYSASFNAFIILLSPITTKWQYNKKLRGQIVWPQQIRLTCVPNCITGTADWSHQYQMAPEHHWKPGVTQFRERIDNFKRQLSTFRLNISDCEKAQTLAENGHVITLDPNPKCRVTESSPLSSSHLSNGSNQEWSRPNSPATRMPNSWRSPSPSTSNE